MKNMFIKVLSVVMALTMIMGAFGTIALAADAACEHEWKTETVAPTCTTPGYTVYTCEKCDTVEFKDHVESTGTEHNYEDADAIAATCTTPAKSAGQVCTICGNDTRTVTAPAKGHNLGEVQIEEPDCNKVGKIFKACADCDYVEVLQTIDATGNNAAGATCHTGDHVYVYVFEVIPSCTDAGLLIYICQYCGDAKANVTGDKALGHDYDHDDNGSDDITVANPTCTATGSNTKVCENCGHRDVETINALGHNWDRNGDGKKDAADYVGTAPTCTAVGTWHYDCTRCDATSTEGINNAIVPHTMVAITEAHKCVLDRNNDADSTNDVLKLKQDATCYEAGYQWKHCSVCDYISCETIPQATAHKWNATTFTRTDNNNTAGCPGTVATYKVCDYCGIEELVSEVIDGHVWYTNKTYKAANPSYTYATGADNDTYFKVVGNNSCVTATKYYTVCKDCGYEKLDHTTNAVPHTWEAKANWQFVAYTGSLKVCEEGAANYYIRECTVCNASENVLYFTQPHTMNAYSCTAGCAAGACNNCEHTGRQLVCSVCLGNGQDAKETHDWRQGTAASDKIHDAYCGGPAEWTFYCKNDKCAATKVAEVGAADPDNHDDTDIDNDGRFFLVSQRDESSCVQAGFAFGICYECGDATNEVVEPLALAEHKYQQVAAKVDSDCVNNGKEAIQKCTVCDHEIGGGVIPAKGHTNETIPAVNATCSSTGLTAGVKCSVCKVILTEQTFVPTLTREDEEWNDPANHIHNDGATITTVYTVAATCFHGTLTYKKYGSEADVAAGKACGHIIRESDNTLNPYNHNDYIYDDVNNDGNWVLTTTTSLLNAAVAVVPATCTANGYHAYQICGKCDVIVNVDTTTCNNSACTKHTELANLAQYDKDGDKVHDERDGDRVGSKFTANASKFVIAALGHDFVKVANKVLETCTADGHQEIWRCSIGANCSEKVTVEGTVVGALCPETGKNGATIPAHGTAGVFTKTDVSTTCTTNGSKAGSYCNACAANGYTNVNDCDACDGNDWEIVTNGHKIALHYTSARNCATGTAGYKVYKCENCDATSTTLTGEKINGNVVSVNTLIWYFTDYQSADHYYKADADGDGSKTVVTKDYSATCTAPKTTVNVCQDCGHEEFAKTEGNALGHTTDCKEGNTCTTCNTVPHTYIVVVNNDPAIKETYDCTKATVVTNLCTTCGDTTVVETINAPGHVYAGTVSYVEPTDLANGVWTWECKNCENLVETEITMERKATVDISVAPYAPGVTTGLNFVNGGLVEVTVSITLGETDVKGFDYQLNFNNNKLEFVDVELAYNTFVRDGEYVEIDMFEVGNNDDNVKVSAFFAGNTSAIMSGNNAALLKFIFKVAPTVTAIEKTDIATASFSFLNETGHDSITITTLAADYETKLMGDVNFDGKYDGRDLVYIMSIIRGVEGFEYTTVADINNDGAITLADYAKVAKFANSDQTVADYYAMFDYDIVDMLSTFAYADYNKDGNINELDKTAMANAIKAEGVNADAAWTATLNAGYYEQLLKDLANELLNPTYT